jgi:hypothetical protein
MTVTLMYKLFQIYRDERVLLTTGWLTAMKIRKMIKCSDLDTAILTKVYVFNEPHIVHCEDSSMKSVQKPFKFSKCNNRKQFTIKLVGCEQVTTELPTIK